MDNLDAKLDALYAKLYDIDYMLEVVCIDDTTLLERRDLLLEEIGLIMEQKTLASLFDYSKDYG